MVRQLKPGDECWGCVVNTKPGTFEPEHFFGAHKTRSDALAEAMAENPEAHSFWVCRGVAPDPMEFLSAEDIICQLDDCNGEPFIDDVPWDYESGAESALSEALQQWAAKHVRPIAWRGEEAELVLNEEGSEGE